MKIEIPKIASVVENAYHGTGLEIAERIRNGEQFQPSKGDRHFLGDGVYFFEGSKELAKRWAKQQHGEIAILCAEIALGICLDLNTMEHRRILMEARDQLIARLKVTDINKVRDVTDGWVINFFATKIIRELDTVKYTFIRNDAKALYPSSRIKSVEPMICVRNTASISNIEIEN